MRASMTQNGLLQIGSERFGLGVFMEKEQDENPLYLERIPTGLKIAQVSLDSLFRPSDIPPLESLFHNLLHPNHDE